MSVPAARIRTSSGWRDIAIQGAQGPAGRNPSCKAQSSIAFAAADTYYRGVTCNFTTIVFDDWGNSFSPSNVWTCRETGRYLLIGSYEGMANQGEVGLSLLGKDTTGIVRVGADARKWGRDMSVIGNVSVGAQYGLAGYHSGGGGGVFTLEVIQLAGSSGIPFGSPLLVTALPIAPVDGTEVYYLADATNGVVWHLRYRAAAPGSYKWEFLGGSPLYAEALAGSGTTIGAGSFLDGDNPGPSITVPLAGIYDLEPTVQHAYNNTANVDVQVGYKIGAAATVGCAYAKALAANWSPIPTVQSRVQCAAADVVKLQYYVSTGGAVFFNRHLRLRPVRVG